MTAVCTGRALIAAEHLILAGQDHPNTSAMSSELNYHVWRL
jgi:hypothetical protein